MYSDRSQSDGSVYKGRGWPAHKKSITDKRLKINRWREDYSLRNYSEDSGFNNSNLELPADESMGASTSQVSRGCYSLLVRGGGKFEYSQRGNCGGNSWKRGRNHGARYYQDKFWNQEDVEKNRVGNLREQKGRHPPGLRGKEIGLWYARQNRAKKEKQSRNVVTLNKDQEHNIRRLLETVRQQRRSTVHLVKEVSSAQENTDDLDDDDDDDDDDDEGLLSGNQEDLAQEGNSLVSNSLSVQNEPVSVVDEIDDGEVEEVHILTNAELSEAGSESMIVGELDSGPPFPVTQSSSIRSLELLEELKQKQQLPQYKKMLEFRQKLPCYGFQETIIRTVGNNKVVVISGETGCGKTTQVPQFILDNSIMNGKDCRCRIICTQPRRISAISVAERVAAERCENLGSSVGYQIRLEHKLPRTDWSILFCTTGIVLKFLESDPLLSCATHIILDEIHERDLHSDFMMIILKDLLLCRSDLKVILMSATLNAEMFSQYFYNCPMLNIPGYTFPVENLFLEDIFSRINYNPQCSSQFKWPRRRFRLTPEEQERQDNYQVWLRNQQGQFSPCVIEQLQRWEFSVDHNLICQIVVYIMKHMEKKGAILIFVPGWDDISKVSKQLQNDMAIMLERPLIIPLHSMMPTVNQKQVFDRPPEGMRKIVVATNIAETSITIDDIVYVIDCGKIKMKDFLPQSNLCTLEARDASKANAKQRQGRAGRTQPGVCFKLYTRFNLEQMADQQPPEMLRTPLEELCLQIKLLKLGKIQPFVMKALEPPSLETLTRAISLLQDMKALDVETEELLPLGYHLARLPVDPHCGKMLLFAAMFSCLDPMLTLSAALSYKDAFVIPLGQEKKADEARKRLALGSKSDHFMLINAFEAWEKASNKQKFCFENFLSNSILLQLQKMKQQLAVVLFDMGFINSSNPKDPFSNCNSENHPVVSAVICAGLYPNVAQVTKEAQTNARFPVVCVTTKTDRRAALHPRSVNSAEAHFPSKWLVYYQKLKTSKVYLYDCGIVPPYPLLLFGGSLHTFYEGNNHCISVDKWIVFYTTKEIADLVKELRCQLDQVLQESVDHPQAVMCEQPGHNGEVLSAIIELLFMEDLQQTSPGHFS